MENKVSNTWGLKVGDKVRCTESYGYWLVEGKLYEVVEVNSNGHAVVCGDSGNILFPELAIGASFEVVKEDEDVDTEVSDVWGLKLGDKVLCTISYGDLLTGGKLYEVVEIDIDGDAVVYDDNGDKQKPEYYCSNFEPIKEDEKVDTEVSRKWKLKVGDKVKCTKSLGDWLTEGKLYEVVEIKSGGAVVIDDEGDGMFPELTNGSSFEAVKEDEKVDTKVSRRWGLKEGDKVRCIRSLNGWLTEGKLYEVVWIDNERDAVVIDDEGDDMFPEIASGASFEIVREEVTSEDNGHIYVDTSGMSEEELDILSAARYTLGEGIWDQQDGREVSLQELESIAFRNIARTVLKKVDSEVKEYREGMIGDELKGLTR